MTDAQLSERLARIEVNQQNQNAQLNKVLDLLDRMVRVEERQQNSIRKSEEINIRLKHAEAELDSWRLARRIIAWTSGVVGAIITAWAVYLVRAPAS